MDRKPTNRGEYYQVAVAAFHISATEFYCPYALSEKIDCLLEISVCIAFDGDDGNVAQVTITH